MYLFNTVEQINDPHGHKIDTEVFIVSIYLLLVPVLYSSEILEVSFSDIANIILLYELRESKDHSHSKLTSIFFSAAIIYGKREDILYGPALLANAWAMSTVVRTMPLILSKRRSKTP